MVGEDERTTAKFRGRKSITQRSGFKWTSCVLDQVSTMCMMHDVPHSLALLKSSERSS